MVNYNTDDGSFSSEQNSSEDVKKYARDYINNLRKGVSAPFNNALAGDYAPGIQALLGAYDPEHLEYFEASLKAIANKYPQIKELLEAPTAPSYTYPLHPLSYFKDRPRRTWGVDKLVFDRGSSLFVGDGGSGKSAFVLDMYICRVCEVPFLDRETKPAFLVWVAAESIDDIFPRAQAKLDKLEVSVDEASKLFWILDGRMPFNNTAEVELFCTEVEAQLRSIGVTKDTHTIAFVFDTYAKCTPGADENSTQETKNITDSIDCVTRAFNGHVTIIHHTNAQGKVKGNTALRNHVDSSWIVSKDGDKISLHCDKMRGDREPDDFHVEMRSIVLDESNPFETAPVIFPLDEAITENFIPRAHRQMLELLQTNGELSTSQWQKLSEDTYKIARSTFHSHLQALIKNGLVTPPPNPPVKGKKVFYSLTEKGVQACSIE